jgi:hypothetical protein
MLIANALLNFELFAQRGNTNALFIAEVLDKFKFFKLDHLINPRRVKWQNLLLN